LNLESGPWRGEKWWVSHFNYEPEVTAQLQIPRRVTIHDVTLRDGEQTPGVVFRKDEKIAIARGLNEVGVHRIEAGMPVVSEEDFQAVKAIAHDGLAAQIVAFCRLVKEDVDAALRCDVPAVICEGPTGYPKLKYQFEWTSQHVLEKAMTIVEYAKDHGLQTTFFAVDSTRAELSSLLEIYRKVTAEAKADSVAVVDTFGCCTPEAMRYLVSKVKVAVKTSVEVHCHNDFGMGTANAVASVTAGADIVHASVGGLAERTGNAVLEEVALALQLLYGVNLGLRPEKLGELAALVQKSANFTFQTNKPVTGQRAFTREAGISIAGWMKYNLGSEAYSPDLVGNAHGVVLGKKSGKHSIEWKLGRMGLHANEQQLVTLLDMVKKESERKKGEVTDPEFKAMATSVLAGR
jgi:methanogen homocitrate synthase